MRTLPLAALVVLVSLEAVAQEVPRALPVGKFMAPAGPREARLIGPTGTLPAEVYRKRRKLLMDTLKTGATLIINEARFEGLREGMDFYYLTGIDEPGAALLLDPKSENVEHLFLAPLDVEEERWNGERSILPAQAMELATGIKTLWRTKWMQDALLAACGHGDGLNFVGEFAAAPAPKPKVMTAYAEAVERTYGCEVKNKHGLLARLREVKEPEELKLLRKGVVHTAAGHARILEVLKPGLREFELKDAIEAAFRASGSRHVSYDSIVGSGPNGAVLHYPKDDRVMKDGELVVVDAGAEAEFYATDVTRTYPVGGKFSAEQREIYDLVLRAQAAGIAAAKPGVTVRTISKAVSKVIDDAGYHDAYIHGCCHFVGLEVHDPGEYEKPLPVGAVLTVEPGIYLPQRGFGVRIEDEVLITAGGNEVITRDIPKDADAIEKALAAKR
jgi:Xaa-Pro aminopeptidase